MSTELEADRPAATPWPWWRRHATTLLLVVCLAALATLGASSLVAWLRPGPLSIDCCGGTVTSHAKIGDTFAWASNVKNTGPSRVVLLSARLIPDRATASSHAIEVIETRASLAQLDIGTADWPDRAQGWSDENVPPLRDVVVDPHGDAFVLFVFRARARGHNNWRAIEITYEAGGRTYTTRSDDSIRVFGACTDTKAFCP